MATLPGSSIIHPPPSWLRGSLNWHVVKSSPMSKPDLEGRRDTETQTVQLDIPKAWIFWSGKYPGGPKASWNRECKRWEAEEPMDEEGFDESTAFPLLKPNIEVLWPSNCHSRKARGWYQVKPWPLRPPSSPQARDSHSHPATGADVAEELFELILGDLGWDGDRHTVANCGQVCRYWADHCQAILFDPLTLRTRRDALTFRDFTQDPACGFLPFLKHVYIEVAGLSGLDWIHLLAPLKGATWNAIDLELRGPLRARTQKLRSVHQAIPRSLPRYFSRGIGYLSLTDINFRRFEDLTHLVGELPDLVDLRCTKVTWEALPSAVPRRRPTVDRNRLMSCSMEDCSPLRTRAATFLLNSIASRASDHNDLCTNFFALLDTILELRNTVSYCLRWGYTGSNANHLSLYHSDINFDLWAESPGHDTNSIPGGSSAFRLTAFTITFHKDDAWASIDWVKLDAFVVHLPFLQTVILGFQDRRDMRRFAEEVVDRRTLLSSGCASVKYAVKGANVNRWFRASRESKELRGPGCRHLHEVYNA